MGDAGRGEGEILQSVTLQFDAFGSTTLAAHATDSGRETADLLVTAARYYLAEVERGRFVTRVPAFARDLNGSRTRKHEFCCELPAEAVHALTSQATKQGVSLSCLLEHAALLYLSDVDSGKVAQRVAERSEANGD